jgi:CRISPR/Cas system-associated protein Cas7 (RAMP superfamily)
MRTVISELWTFSITLWKNRNTEYHGTDGAISLEHRRRETATAAEDVYNSTIGSVSPSDSIVLHQQSIETILQWNQEHLDAYLQSAEIILAQRDEAAG